MKTQISVGIDLGTTFSSAAYVNENGQPEIIPNESQQDAISLPSVVFYESEKSIVVGDPAITEAEVSPDKVIRSAKRFIGEDYEPPSGVPQDETPVKFQSKILKAIKKYIEDHSNGYEIKNAVITVPAYFNSNRVNLTREAAKRADIDVLEIINEPMAAAIYYCAGYHPENKKILVYDLGGGTFDTVIIELRIEDGKTSIVTLADDGNHQLGGDDWDKRLMSLLLKKAREANDEVPYDVDEMEPDDRQKLWKKANDLKRALGETNEKSVRTIEFGDITVRNTTVSREEFENETSDLLLLTGSMVDNVLNMANLTENDIDLVLLVGGSTFMPMVQHYVNEKFGEEKVKLNKPNLAVAYGAAIYAQNMDYYKEINNPNQTNLVNAKTQSESGSTDWLPENEGDHTREGPKTPPAFGDIEIKVNASHSLGVRTRINGKPYVTNIIYKGDEYPIEVTREEFISPSDGGFSAVFYENTNVDRDSDIEMAENPNATGDDDYCIPLDSRDTMEYLGKLIFNDERIKAEDQVKVTIIASQSGSSAIVEHVNTGVSDTLQFKNKHTSTEEEIERDKKELDSTTVMTD